MNTVIPPLKIFFAFLLFFVLGIVFAALGASAPIFSEYFGLANSGSLAISIYMTGALSATVAIAAWAGHLNGKIVMRILFVLFLLGMLLMAMSVDSWGLFLVGTFMAGIGNGGMVVLLNTIFAHAFSDRSVIMTNRLNAIFGIGAILGPIFSGWLGSRHILLLPVIAGVLVACSYVATSLGTALNVPNVTKGRSPQKEHLPVVAFISLLFIAFFYSALEITTGIWSATYLALLDWNLQLATASVSGFWLGIAIGRLILPPLTKRFTASFSLLIYFAAGIAAFALMLVAKWALIAYLLIGFSIAPILPTLIAIVTRISQMPHRMISLITIFAWLGGALIPLLMDFFSSSLKQNPPFIVGSLVSVCAAGLLFSCLARFFINLKQGP